MALERDYLYLHEGDKVVQLLEHIIKKVAQSEEVLSFMVELRIINRVKLYEHSIYTAVLGGLVAGCMGLPTDQIW